MVMLLTILLCLTGYKLRPKKINFYFEQPDDISEYEKTFDSPLFFNESDCGIYFEKTVLEESILLANPELLTAHEKFAKQELDRLYPAKRTKDKVSNILRDNLLHGNKMSMDSLASELAMSVRTLQKKLKQEGSSYQTILDGLRKEIALEYLKDPDVTFNDIAFLLGFSEQSAFNRAFKRWTGHKPKDFRS
jgi:AraC-like DNA-binding protein